MHRINTVDFNFGECPYNALASEVQEFDSILACAFQAKSLYTVESREHAFLLVESIEQGIGSCSNLILHEIDGYVEIIWSGCHHVRGPVINKALQGLHATSMNIINEVDGSSRVITVVEASLQEVQSRFDNLYSSQF